MSRWYRAYAGTIKDDKLAEVAVIAGCSRSVSIAVWHAILESAAETEDGGRYETTPRRVAAALCEPLTVIQAVFDGMSEIGMIEGEAVRAWKARQYESDKSTERSRRHRETKRNGDATLQGRCATPPETEADTDTDTKEDAASAASSASAPALDLIEAERRCREASGSDALGSFGPIAELLLRSESPVDIDLDALPVIRARPAGAHGIKSWRYYAPIIAEAAGKRIAKPITFGPPKVFVKVGTPEWDARLAAGHKASLCKFYPEFKAEGWFFPAPSQFDQWEGRQVA
jgi:hypothetical protein